MLGHLTLAGNTGLCRAVPWRGRAACRWLPGAAPRQAAAASLWPFASPVSPLKYF